ncbi:hypothetical protein R3I94_011717 [Phoxinus phoxinus]
MRKRNYLGRFGFENKTTTSTTKIFSSCSGSGSKTRKKEIDREEACCEEEYSGKVASPLNTESDPGRV